MNIILFFYAVTYVVSTWNRVFLGKLIVCLANQEIPRILWKLNVHYRIHNGPLLVLVLSYEINVQIQQYFSKIHFNIILHLNLVFQVVAFNATYFTHSFPHALYMLRQSHSPLFDYINNI